MAAKTSDSNEKRYLFTAPGITGRLLYGLQGARTVLLYPLPWR